MHDRDTKFTKSFNEKFSIGKGDVKLSAFRSPNTCCIRKNASFSRYSKNVLTTSWSLARRTRSSLLGYRTHYELERPHQGRANELIVTANHGKRSSQEPETIRLGEIHRTDRLGCLLKSYNRKAA